MPPTPQSSLDSIHGDLRALHEDVKGLPDAIEASTARGVASGMMALMADDEAANKFWDRVFDRLVSRGSARTKSWIGGRILAALGGMLLFLGGLLVAKYGWPK